MKRFLSILFMVLLVSGTVVVTASAQTMSRYSWDPPVVSDSSQPNTMILLSNDWTGFTEGYVNEPNYDNDKDYWGYFDPNKYYEYKTSAQGYWVPVGPTSNHYHPGGNYWSGNFLNWATMSSVDFLRKALTGGRRIQDSVGNTRLERGVIASGRAWKKTHNNAELSSLVPAAYADTSYQFYNTGITMTVRKSNGSNVSSDMKIRVTVCDKDMPEDNCVLYPSVGEYKPQGLLHKYADKMRFALMTYSHARVDAGGVLRKQMGDVSTEYSSNNGQENQGTNDTMIRYINNYTEKGWDPLAEMYYEALRYFKGNKAATDDYCTNNLQSDDGFNVYGCRSNKDWGDDPIIDWCQKNNILILNDEYPSREHDQLPGTTLSSYTHATAWSGGDANIRPYTPDVAALTKAVGDHEGIHAAGTTWYAANVAGGGTENNNCTTPKSVWNLAYVHGICPTEADSYGTFYLAGLAHDAFTSDFRIDHEGTQNITTWTLAYRATSAPNYEPPVPPMNQMWLAAKYGNFDDLNGNGWPDSGEWEDPKRTDESGSPMPRGFYSASDGKQLVDALDRIFSSILETTASSTAVSVLANSGQGEGNLVQAYYRPRLSQGDAKVDWIGFLQSLWVDEYGYIREDTGGDDSNRNLDHTVDRVIRYVEEGGSTKVRRYAVSDANPYPDLSSDPYDVIELEEVQVLWDAGRILSKTDPIKRKIFTFIDKDKDGVVDDTSANVFDDDGEVLKFYDRNYRALMPYLNVQDDVLDSYLGRSQKIRALNLVRWVQGYDQEVNPDKFVDLSNIDTRLRSLNGTDVFKLGDIVNSTPVTIAAPPDNYHIIYSDESYKTFYDKYKDRETIVYTGANDGMLHAFTSWEFNRELSTFVDPDPPSGVKFGSEMWAYIPQSLLPHLKWLPRVDYSHVYYVDMQPRVFDARVFINSSGTIDDPVKHPEGWGTILVGGFGIGGGYIWVDDRFDDGSGTLVQETRGFYPTYFAIDITDPRHPELLWEKSYDGLGMSYVYPTVMRVDRSGDNYGEWYMVFGSGPDDGSRSMPTPQYDGESQDPGYVYVVDLKDGTPYTRTANDWLFSTADLPTPIDNAFMGPPVSYDHFLDYNVDAAYIPIVYDDSNGSKDWKGGVYKVTVPWVGDIAAYGDRSTGGIFEADPADAVNGWKGSLMFDSPRPISASPALSIDGYGNTWVYVGTGRLFDGDDSPTGDFGSTEDEFLFGLKDPFFDTALDGTYYLNYNANLTLNTTSAPAHLFDADPYLVLDNGQVYEWNGFAYTPYKYFDDMVYDARAFRGWKRTLYSEVDDDGVTRYMRNLNKPSVIGGLSLFSTFMPTGDSCSFGGSSALYILYYETGTAFKRSVTRGSAGYNVVEVDGDAATEERQVKDHIDLGSGSTSSVGIHIGRQNDKYDGDGDNPEGDMITGFVQQGTGKVVEIDIETAIKIRSGLRAWKEN